MIEAALRDRRLSTLTPEAVWRAISGRGGRVLAVRCLGIAALFGFEVALARSLGVTGYGAFSFGLALAGLASRLGPLGWLSTRTRPVSRYVSLGKDCPLQGIPLVSHSAPPVGPAPAPPPPPLSHPAP